MRPTALAFIPVVLALLACDIGSASVAQASASPAQTPTATPHTEQGIPVSASPIQLIIPEGLATGATADTIDVVTDQTGAQWDVAP
ncbi:MAG TPA: hypothetical protein VGA61_11355, partial [Anaerolineae bacterium]